MDTQDKGNRGFLEDFIRQHQEKEPSSINVNPQIENNQVFPEIFLRQHLEKEQLPININPQIENNQVFPEIFFRQHLEKDELPLITVAPQDKSNQGAQVDRFQRHLLGAELQPLLNIEASSTDSANVFAEKKRNPILDSLVGSLQSGIIKGIFDE